jgi:DNA polymerase-3 subunit gamma/tau
MIARAATGSFRDALGHLEQLVTYGGKEVKLEDVLEVLGVADAELILDAAEAIAERDPRTALTTVQRLSESGRDYVQFMRDLAAHLRHLFVVQTLGDVPESFAVTSEHTDRLEAQAGRMNQGEILRAIDLLAAAIAAVKDGAEPRIQLEMALLKAAQPSSDLSLQALMFRIEQLEARIAGGSAAAPTAEPVATGAPPPAGTPASAKAASAAAPAANVTAARASAPAVPRATTAAAASAAAGASAPAAAAAPAEATEAAPAIDIDIDKLLHLWPAALEVLAQQNEMLGAVLSETKPQTLSGSRFVIGFPPGSEFARKKAEAKRDVVERALHGLTGASLNVAFEMSSDVRAPEPRKLSTDELIEKVKSEFEATELEPDGEQES